MTPPKKLLNFLPHSDPHLRTLQGATFVVLSFCGVLSWILVFGGSSSHVQTATIERAASLSSGSSSTPTPLIHVPSSTPKALSTVSVTAVGLGQQPDSVRYYEAQTGKASEVDAHSGTATVLIDHSLNGFQEAWWIPGQTLAIIAQEKQHSTQYALFHTDTNQSSVFGHAISNIAIASDGSRMAYIDTIDGVAGVYISDAAHTYDQKIMNTRLAVDGLSWQDSTHLAITSRRPDDHGSDLTRVSLTGDIAPLLDNREGLEYAWSPDGSYALISSFNTAGELSLTLLSVATRVETPLPFATSASKCTWGTARASIICGIPSQPSLTHDVPSERTATNDDIVLLNMDTLTTTPIYQATKNALFSVMHPIVSSSGRFLFFTNLFDGKLYELAL